VSGAGDEGPSGDSDQEKSIVKDLPGLAAFATMGTTIASCLAVGVVLGLWVDHVLRSGPWGLLLGIVLGTVAAVASVIKLVRRFL
jgi:F0F1-type ATP synthase assembly protein I